MTSIWKCLPLALVWLAANAGAAAPGILITNLPAYNTLQNVSGLVCGTNSAGLAVAVFIYVPGYGWATKPTCAQPLTSVQPDGSWTADIATESIRINLWLNGGTAPANKYEVEVIIKSFQFVPLQRPPGPRLTRLMPGSAQFAMDSQPDRRYEFETSSNLFQWQSLGIILATNRRGQFRRLDPYRAYRVLLPNCGAAVRPFMK
jgi:hypothetical protein